METRPGENYDQLGTLVTDAGKQEGMGEVQGLGEHELGVQGGRQVNGIDRFY